MDHGFKGRVGLVETHGDAFERRVFHQEVPCQVSALVDFRVDDRRQGGRDGFAMRIGAPCAFLTAKIRFPSKALSASIASTVILSIRGAAPAVSMRCPGSRPYRPRFPRASVSAGILVVQPPCDLPVARSCVPL